MPENEGNCPVGVKQWAGRQGRGINAEIWDD